MLNSYDTLSPSSEVNQKRIVLIDERCLERECFVRGIGVVDPSISVDAFATVGDWIDHIGQTEPPVAILYSTLGRRVAERNVADEIAALEKASRPVPVVVLSPFEELSEMIAALDCGARGFIPAALGIEAMLTAVRLSAEGAVFMTAATVLAIRGAIESPAAAPAAVAQKELDAVEGQFTTRQAAVADRLRRGKPNKLIAYELNMCESTVKVHIRNIMKKLRATNRTEASFKLNSLVAEWERGSAPGAVAPTAAHLAPARSGAHAGVLARTASHALSG